MKQAILISTGLLLTTPFIHAEKNKDKKPNVVFILADDLGYGDLSCYGQEKFETPNIDKLAQSGMRFTQCYSGTTVSAPSRSCLLTGTHSGHTPVRGNLELDPEGQFPLPDDARTIFEVMKDAGYKTSAFGNGDWAISVQPAILKIKVAILSTDTIANCWHTVITLTTSGTTTNEWNSKTTT